MEKIFRISSERQFVQCCLEIFHFQYENNSVYRQYTDLLNVSPCEVDSIDKIPFLPIKYFKTKRIISSPNSSFQVQKIFTSSSTTGMTPSQHFITDLSLYERDFMECFRLFYGAPEDYTILALLPSYLERDGSSLVYMVNALIKASHSPNSGYYLYNHDELFRMLCTLQKNRCKTLLLGVTFALLDFAAKYKIEPALDWDFIVMETGGMKGRGDEIPRNELHSTLKSSFGVSSIHSEYGMCEMLSQGYSKGDGIFKCPPWMQVLIRDTTIPFTYLDYGKKGAINVIDLANINSCSFIETEDMGIKQPEETFVIDGRLSGAERRGCNMLIE